MSDDRYIYISAKLRVLERHLMNEADMTRVIDAKTPDIAFKAFNSLDYAGELLDLEAKDYRIAMERKLTRLKKLFEQTIPDKDLLRLLFLERDFHNIKVLFKEKVSGSEYAEHLEDAPGLIAVDQLRRYIVDDLGAEIEDVVKKEIDELKKDIGDTADPETVENLVDRKLNHVSAALTERIGNPFVTTLFRYMADRNNISLFLRARKLGKTSGWFRDRVNDHGTIPASAYMDAYDTADDSDFISRLKGRLPNVIESAAEEYLKDRAIWRLELGMDNVIMAHVDQAKRIAYGPEVVVAYYFRKKYAIRNLSAVMALKFGEVEPAEIRHHIVDTH